ncbi:MAG: polysaccharide deacetylase family protein, partial [candidate division Zixibacteria bacterium]|nr:polysaccharide deacetylase family protein [candidate division Zixibacteria bacterium]
MKNFLRKPLAVLAHVFGLWHLFYRLVRPLSGHRLLVVFTYHRVIDGSRPARHYMFYEKGLDAAVFARHIRFIKKYYRLADLNEFTAIVTGEKPLHRHTALITFDDADSEYMEHVLPVVRAQACPVTLFVPTGFVETGRKFWHVRVSDIMRNVTPESWGRLQAYSARLPEDVAEPMATPFPNGEEQKAAVSRLLNARLDRLDHRRIDEIIAAWEAIVERHDTLDVHCLNWSQLKYLADHNTSLQSHTVTHRKLAGLPAEEIEAELAASRTHLEQRLGQAVTAISYPQGSVSDA